MTEFLVELGIDSISLNPDAITKTTRQVLDIEQRLAAAAAGARARAEAADASSRRPDQALRRAADR